MTQCELSVAPNLRAAPKILFVRFYYIYFMCSFIWKWVWVCVTSALVWAARDIDIKSQTRPFIETVCKSKCENCASFHRRPLHTCNGKTRKREEKNEIHWRDKQRIRETVGRNAGDWMHIYKLIHIYNIVVALGACRVHVSQRDLFLLRAHKPTEKSGMKEKIMIIIIIIVIHSVYVHFNFQVIFNPSIIRWILPLPLYI